MTVDETRALVLPAFEAYLAGDLAGLETVLAPDCVPHQCSFLEPLSGDELRDFLRGGGQALSERRRWVEMVVAEGNMVAIRWNTTGKHTGKQVTFSSMTFIRVEGDTVAELWNIQDTATLGMQLAEPAANR